MLHLVSSLGIEGPRRRIVLNHPDEDEAHLLCHPLRSDVPPERHEVDHSEPEYVKAPTTRQGPGSGRRTAVTSPGGGPVTGDCGSCCEVDLAEGHGSEQLAVSGVAKGEGRAPFLAPKSVVLHDPSAGVVLLVGLGDTGRPARDFGILTGPGHGRDVVEGEAAQAHHSVGQWLRQRRECRHE